MLTLLRLKFPEVLKAVAPLFAAVCVLQLLVVGAPAALFLQFVVGALLALAGMLLLLAGIDFGVLPMGHFIGAELPRKGSLWLIAGVAFALGYATTAAEPDVLVLAGQVEAASQGAMREPALVYMISVGVALLAAVGLLRIVWGFSMIHLLAVVFAIIIALSFVAPETFVPLAYDAGSVTTGVLTAPVMLALALGLSSVLGNRSSLADGFGLLGLGSAGPIIVILLAGLLFS
jgi:hypothetical protein